MSVAKMNSAILADPTDNNRRRGREVSETRATTPVFPPGRYGRRRSGRRRSILPYVALAVIVAGSLFLSARLYQQFGRTDFESQIVGWDSQPAPDVLNIQFKVRVPAGAAASCVLRARDYDGFEVGRRTVVVRPAGDATTIDAREPVTTTRRASVGDVLGCRPAG
jgi:hypothetical protein